MSAPNLPRFTTGSVSGYPISNALPTDQRPSTLWYVWDSWRGYAIVRDFRGAKAKRSARTLAAQLEREHADDLAGRSGEANLRPDQMEGRPVIHGDLATYNNHGCRCAKCRAEKSAYNRWERARV